MKLLFLTIITIVFSSNLDAKTEELDRDKYFYVCSYEKIEDDRCPGIKKGDVLNEIDAKHALMYCDTDYPIFDANINAEHKGRVEVTCLYNGAPIKKAKRLGKFFR